MHENGSFSGFLEPRPFADTVHLTSAGKNIIWKVLYSYIGQHPFDARGRQSHCQPSIRGNSAFEHHGNYWKDTYSVLCTVPAVRVTKTDSHWPLTMCTIRSTKHKIGLLHLARRMWDGSCSPQVKPATRQPAFVIRWSTYQSVRLPTRLSEDLLSK